MENLLYVKGTTFVSAELRKSTDNIRRLGDNIKKNYLKIAWELADIDEKESYLDDNFESTVDYAMKVFNMAKSSAYVLIAVGRDWLLEPDKNGNIRTVLTESGTDYSISQLGILLPLGSERTIELHDAGTINPNMSVRELKAIVKKEKKEQEKLDEEPEGEETEGEESVELSETITVGSVTFYDGGEIAFEGDFPEWFVIELESMYKKVLADSDNQ